MKFHPQDQYIVNLKSMQMALSSEMRRVLELLMNALLARKENFRALFTKMMPLIHYEDEFFLAFFLGYIAHSYKQLFLILASRDMQPDEINDMLEFLMRNQSKIREALVGRQAPLEEIEHVPEKAIERVPETEEKARPPEIIEKINALELSIDEIRQEINVIKGATREQIIRYEVQLAKSGKPIKSILR